MQNALSAGNVSGQIVVVQLVLHLFTYDNQLKNMEVIEISSLSISSKWTFFCQKKGLEQKKALTGLKPKLSWLSSPKEEWM